MMRLIVPTDLSPGSQKALDFALMLSRHQAAEITLVYVCADPRGAAMCPVDTEEALAKESLEHMIQGRSGELGKGSTLRYVIRHGIIYKEILREARPIADCRLILTSHGTSGYDHRFPGGVAYRLAAGSRMPVFYIPVSGDLPATINNIVIPLDDSYETLEKIPATADLAKLFNATVHLATVTTSSLSDIRYLIRASSDRAESILRKAEVNFETEILFGSNISNLALEFADHVEADMISLMSERSKSARNSLLGPYAHHMVTKTSKVLMIHEPAPKVPRT